MEFLSTSPRIPAVLPPSPTLVLSEPRPTAPVPRGLTGGSKAQFFVMGALVYAAATTDMVSTRHRMRSEQVHQSANIADGPTKEGVDDLEHRHVEENATCPGAFERFAHLGLQLQHIAVACPGRVEAARHLGDGVRATHAAIDLAEPIERPAVVPVAEGGEGMNGIACAEGDGAAKAGMGMENAIGANDGGAFDDDVGSDGGGEVDFGVVWDDGGGMDGHAGS